jgi:hypothetical protein
MKKLAKHSLLPVLPALLLGLALWFSMSPSVRAQTQDIQVVEIRAKKYEYSSSKDRNFLRLHAAKCARLRRVAGC